MGGLRDLINLSVPPEERSVWITALDAELQQLLAAESDDPAPAPEGPVSLRLLSALASKDPADTPTSVLVEEVCAWQRFTGFSTSRIWVHLAELHARFTGPSRARLDAAHAAGDLPTAEYAAGEIDLAERSVIAEAQAALSWSGWRAADQVRIAVVLTTDLVKTLDAVTHGRLEVLKAEELARGLLRESSDLRRKVEAEVLDDAAGLTVPGLRDRIRKTVLRLAPELAEERAKRARRGRGVSFTPERDDMMRMEALMPVEAGVKVRAALENCASDLKADLAEAARTGQTTADARTLDQLSCDILTDALINLTQPVPPAAPSTAPNRSTDSTESTDADGANGGTSGTASTSSAAGTASASGAAGSSGAAGASGTRAEAGASGSSGATGSSGTTSSSGASGGGGARAKARRSKRSLRQEIVVTVPFETITGDSDHPGYLSRYGPISAFIARQMAWDVAKDGYWRCAVTDDQHGTLLGLGRSTFSPNYQAPEYLKRFTNIRDQFCDFPGCRQPAVNCDFDHTIPWPGGQTRERDGKNRCGNHHRLKHETSWSVKRSEDPEHPPGTHVWTSPTGREYTTSPPEIGVPTARLGNGPAHEYADPNTDPNIDQDRASSAATKLGRPVHDAWAYDPTLPDLPTATGGGTGTTDGCTDETVGARNDPLPF